MFFFCLQNHSVYDSTQFDTNATPINPLYAASLQSPDSITGYSIDSQEAQNPPNGYQQWTVVNVGARSEKESPRANLDMIMIRIWLSNDRVAILQRASWDPPCEGGPGESDILLCASVSLKWRAKEKRRTRREERKDLNRDEVVSGLWACIEGF